MSADDRFLDLAAKISDGQVVDWSGVQSNGNEHEQSTVEELRAFANLLADDGRLRYRSGPADLPAGASWGPLTIVGKVGSGRFGTVYRARDPRLDRDVALKLLTWLPVDPLPPSSAIAEARLLARVRHPNVLTVHGAESIDDQVGIWSEFIEGRTLEEIVREQGPMSAVEVTAIGIDLCRALSAVHKAGLLHRDIKAQNVMRETGGRIVLMDFGTGHDPREIPARPGDLSGTPLYVAPEIFTGGSASVASDIYSLAVVLFHLLTGTYPVPGRSLADVRDGHLSGARLRVLELKGDVPAKLVDVIERGLAVNPAQRFNDSQTFGDALRAVQRAIDPHARPESTRHFHRWKLITAMLAIGTAAIVGTIVWIGTRSSPPRPVIEVQRLTREGYARGPVISPDGTQIAYYRAWEPGAGIWLRAVSDGTERQIFVADDSFNIFGLTFTPDGKELDFVGPGLWRMSLSGGGRRRLATRVGSPVGWSPDGHHMAFIRKQGSETAVVLADPEGSNEQVLATRLQPQYFVNATMRQFATNRPAWSPDGRTIAVATLDVSTDREHSAIALIDVAARREVREIGSLDQSHSQPRILETAWVDQRHLLFSREASDQRNSYQIWLLDMTLNVSEPVIQDPASYVGVSVTANRRLAVAERGSSQESIWLGSSSGEQMSAVVPSSNANPFLGSVNNRGDIVYRSDTSEGPAVWLLRSGQRQSIRVALGDSPVLLSNGEHDRVVFVKDGRQAGLWLVDVDGSQPTQLVKGVVSHPRVTPDGAYVLFVASWSDAQSIWLVPVAGGTTRELIRGAGNGAGLGWWLSADGRQLFAERNNNVTVRCDFPECAALTVLRGDSDPAIDLRSVTQPEPYNEGLAFADAHDVWFMPPGRGKRQQITHFSELVLGTFTFSPNKQWLAIARGIKSSDAVLLKNFR